MRSRSFFFFFNDTATTEIYTLSLHDALPILFVFAGEKLNAAGLGEVLPEEVRCAGLDGFAILHHRLDAQRLQDRKSTRLNSSHDQISYAVFCLKKKIKSEYT